MRSIHIAQILSIVVYLLFSSCGLDKRKLTELPLLTFTKSQTFFVGSTGDDSSSQSLVDSKGNIFLTGQYQTSIKTIGIEDCPLESCTFLAKLSSEGLLLWIKSFPDTKAPKIGLDTQGKIFLVVHRKNGFGTKFFDKDGSLLRENSHDGSCSIVSLRYDNQGNIFLLGDIWGECRLFDRTLITTSESGTKNTFFAKLNNNFQWAWNKIFTGPSNFSKSLTISNQSGNIYIVGRFFENIIFEKTKVTLSTQTQKSNTPSEFIARSDSNGNISWAISLESSSISTSLPTTVLPVSDGVYISFYAKSYSLLGTKRLFLNTKSERFGVENEGIVLAKLDLSGTLQKVYTFPVEVSGSHSLLGGNVYQIKLFDDNRILMLASFYGKSPYPDLYTNFAGYAFPVKFLKQPFLLLVGLGGAIKKVQFLTTNVLFNSYSMFLSKENKLTISGHFELFFEFFDKETRSKGQKDIFILSASIND